MTRTGPAQEAALLPTGARLPGACRPTSPTSPDGWGPPNSPPAPPPTTTPRISLAQNQLADRRGRARGRRGRGPDGRACLGRPMAGRLVGVGHLPVPGHVRAGGHHRPAGEAALVLGVIGAGAWGEGGAKSGSHSRLRGPVPSSCTQRSPDLPVLPAPQEAGPGTVPRRRDRWGLGWGLGGPRRLSAQGSCTPAEHPAPPRDSAAGSVLPADTVSSM